MKIQYHALVIVVLFALSAIYFSDSWSGKVLFQGDTMNWRGMAQEITEHRTQYGEEPLWTNSMFGGMPANMISMQTEGNFFSFILSAMNKMRPIGFIFFAMIGFYLVLLAYNINLWLAMSGAIAFGFCAYNFQIIEAGHNSKMVAIGMASYALAAMVYTLRHRQWLGGVLFGIAVSLSVLAGHPQMTYYIAFVMLAVIVAEWVKAYRTRKIPAIFKRTVILVVAGVLGLASNLDSLLPNLEYSKQTMRGGSELTDNTQHTEGLQIDYATAWSYGKVESFNLFIPNFYGGSSNGELSQQSEVYKALKSNGVKEADQIIKRMPLYWGDVAFTGGPAYLGAISVFLFIFGLFIVRHPVKWFLLGCTVIVLMLSWGKNLMWFTELFFYHVPMYDKFRAVSSILTALQFSVPLLGILAVKEVFDGNMDNKVFWRGLKFTLYTIGGFTLLMALFPGLAGSFQGQADSQLPEWLTGALIEDRKSLLRMDAWRSLGLMIAAAALLFLGIRKKIKPVYAYITLGVLILIDLYPVDKRYLNSDNFVSPKQVNNYFTLRPVDKVILQDTSTYRVLDLTKNIFNDASVSYYHHSIGGYHGAKLQRYQDIIDRHLQPEISSLMGGLNKITSYAQIDSLLQKQQILNMLNAKYIIVNNKQPLINHAALSNAWFVNTLEIAEDANAEMAALDRIDVRTTAVFDQKFATFLPKEPVIAPTAATINLTSYKANRLIYQSSASSEGIAVFSEIYYDKGWKAYIDEQEVPILRADYLLRALVIPQGEHTITFEYKPESYYKGQIYASIASSFLILSLLLIVGFIIAKKKKVSND